MLADQIKTCRTLKEKFYIKIINDYIFIKCKKSYNVPNALEFIKGEYYQVMNIEDSGQVIIARLGETIRLDEAFLYFLFYLKGEERKLKIKNYLNPF